MNPEITHLLWLDLETTGESNPRDGAILEVGVVLTDLSLTVLASRSYVLGLSFEAETQLEQHPVVKAMHTENGLIEDARASLFTLPLVTDSIVGMFADHRVRPKRVMLAGSGISHFDRPFVKAQMPRVEAWLAYPNLDIGVLRRALRYLGDPSLVAPAPASHGETKAHRALADALQHLVEAQMYQALFGAVLGKFGGPDEVTQWWARIFSPKKESSS